MRRIPVLWTLALALLSAACATAGGGAQFDDFGERAPASLDDVTNGLQDSGTAAKVVRRSSDPDADEQPTQQQQQQAADRMLVYRGSVAVEVARADDAAAAFLAKVAEWGGHLSSQRGPQYVVRVPAARFETAFQWVRAAGRVLDESREASDVTDQYLDVGIRLENARKSRERLLALLAKADKVEDMLKIEEQLRRLTEEIERMEGQQKLLADQVAMATLTATFRAVAAAGGPVQQRPSAFPWLRSLGADRLLGRW